MPPIGSFQDIEQGLDFLQLIFGHRVFTGEVELGLELFPIILRHLLAGLLKGEDRHLTIADDHLWKYLEQHITLFEGLSNLGIVFCLHGRFPQCFDSA